MNEIDESTEMYDVKTLSGHIFIYCTECTITLMKRKVLGDSSRLITDYRLECDGCHRVQRSAVEGE